MIATRPRSTAIADLATHCNGIVRPIMRHTAPRRSVPTAEVPADVPFCLNTGRRSLYNSRGGREENCSFGRHFRPAGWEVTGAKPNLKFRVRENVRDRRVAAQSLPSGVVVLWTLPKLDVTMGNKLLQHIHADVES